MATCQQTVYAGRMQYDRIQGHTCGRKAATYRNTLSRTEQRLDLCGTHAKSYVRQGWEQVAK